MSLASLCLSFVLCLLQHLPFSFSRPCFLTPHSCHALLLEHLYLPPHLPASIPEHPPGIYPLGWGLPVGYDSPLVYPLPTERPQYPGPHLLALGPDTTLGVPDCGGWRPTYNLLLWQFS